MTRTARRRSAFVAALVLAAAAALAASAFAAKPKKNARFKGTTNATVIEGFHAPVDFTVSSDGKSLLKFTFGSLGCFGAGGFRPGVSPYTGHSLIDAGKLKLRPDGSFIDHAVSSYTVSGQTVTTKVRISGLFSTPKRLGGTISLTQTLTGGALNQKCGPQGLIFSARAK